MADDPQARQATPAGLAVLVLAALAAVGYHLFTPTAHAEPTIQASSSCSTTSCGEGWVAPVHAPLWGGFRTGSNPRHDGVDLGATRGTPIRAAAGGEVVRAKCDTRPASWGCDRDGSPQIRGCGWYVDLRHANDVYTRYCHMQAAPQVSVGQVVTVGQVLGRVGSTGNSSAPHLHFEVHQGDESSATAVDPVAFMAAHGAPLG